ncbi:MAG: SDR family oxidoreductase [Alphaproteobacteria bacterium]|nr:SDR family oxidoreductase [Alphaproteobacteria bacterium]MBN9571307.1 SDR family oxidoreductase [Alphaproteobacteria bacterium]
MGEKSLQGKVAIVTGSASGIGAATAIGLAERGANVVVNYASSADAAQKTADAVKAAGADVRLVQANVAEDADCKKLAQAALDAWGRIDILVNNAGTTKFVAHHELGGLSAEDFARIYAVNVVGPFQMVRACEAALKAHGPGMGSVVNVSSIAGVAGIGSSIAYAASKGALNTMTLSLARALAPNIRVNAVCPGYVETPWFSKRFGADSAGRIKDQQEKSNPLGLTADGAEIARTVMFFCSPEARNISGERLLTDSGMHLTGFGAGDKR